MADINPEPCSKDIALYYGLIKTEDSNYQRYWRMLAEDEQHYARQLNNERVHKRYVSVHGQLRSVLAQTLQQAPERIIIAKAAHGKPYLVNYPQLGFNLSHCGNVFMIALAWNCQLGVDIEGHKPRDNLAALVKKCFAPEEALYWQQLPDVQKTAEFYRFWTRKEAFVKATGFGIALGLQHCVINPEQPGTFLRIPTHCGDINGWYLQDIDLQTLDSQMIYAALSVDKKITGINMTELAE
jgi:4'-phosphopantetheinyl transferase